MSRKALGFADELFLFFFYRSLALTVCIEASHKKYQKFGRRWSLIFLPGYLPFPPLIFTRGRKCEIWSCFLTPLTFEQLVFRNRGRYLRPETKSMSTNDGPMSSADLVKLGPPPPRTVTVLGLKIRNWTTKMWFIVNNSATDCLILLKFRIEFEHMISDLQRSKVKGQGHIMR